MGARRGIGIYADPAHPRGCLVISAAVNCTTEEVAEELKGRRNANLAAFESRIRADVACGTLPADTDAAALARYVGAVLQGMSQQARDGAGREELAAVAEPALAAWPAEGEEGGGGLSGPHVPLGHGAGTGPSTRPAP